MAETESDSSSERLDKAADFFRDLASRKKERPTAPPFYIRRVALVLGALLGLLYGLSTQLINSIYAPGVPFSHHPFGLIGNCAASIIGFTFICWICSLPKDTYRGALLACLSALLILELRALAVGSIPMTIQAFAAFSFFSLIGLGVELAIALPVMFLLRWTLEIQAENFDKKIWAWQRVRLPLAFAVLAAGLGVFSLYPDEVLAAMADTGRLIDQGLLASNASALPAPLRNENNVQDFIYYAEAPYEVELGAYESYVDPTTFQPVHVIDIVARFKDGWGVVCRYKDRPNNPECTSFDVPHAPPVTDFRAQILNVSLILP